MIDRDRVYSLFVDFSNLGGEDSAHMRCLCDNASTALEGQLRSGIDLRANMERLCATAAVMACCSSLSLNSTFAASDEVRVGDISLRAASGSAGSLRRSAEELRNQFLADIADLLEAPFVFGRIPQSARTEDPA